MHYAMNKCTGAGLYTAGRPVARGDQTRPMVDWMLSIRGPGGRPHFDTTINTLKLLCIYADYEYSDFCINRILNNKSDPKFFLI